jgi:PAS domain S-box-containing protein
MNKPQRKILLIDDNLEDRVTFQRFLQRDPDVIYLFEEVDSGNRGLEACPIFQPDCLLLDYRLPDLDGLQFLKRLHKRVASQVPAVIVLTGAGNEAIAVETMKYGAQDYLVKSRLTSERLRSAVTNAIEKVILQRTLEAQQQQLRHQAEIIDHTHDAIITTDLEGIVRSWNHGAERIFGYTAAEIIGRPIYLLFPDLEDIREQFPTLVLAPLYECGQHELEVPQRSKSGTRVDIQVRLSLSREDNGAPRGITGYATDITARRQAEDALIRQTAELQRINEELQQFSYIVSHDLREPLRTISNFLNLLTLEMPKPIPREAQEYLDFAVDGAQRMQQMITDLLAYTRAGRESIQFSPVDCDAVLTRVLVNLQAAITESGAVITHDSLPTVQGEETLLAQVFQNLIGNALKFRGSAPPRIHVATWREFQHWQFCVRDNGIGIDPTQTKRLFRIFQRLHTRAEYPGTGVGLAICRKIVEQHGGRIWVESTSGNGSSFYFTLQVEE